jgi:hypothetical protein
MYKLTDDNNPLANYHQLVEHADNDAFAKEYNKRQSEYWIHSGSNSSLNFNILALEILIDDYNARHGANEEEGNG